MVPSSSIKYPSRPNSSEEQGLKKVPKMLLGAILMNLSQLKDLETI